MTPPRPQYIYEQGGNLNDFHMPQAEIISGKLPGSQCVLALMILRIQLCIKFQI
jgi:hypothetical protein